MQKMTDKEWEKIKQFGEEHKDVLSKIPEKLDRKMTRLLMQDPSAIPLLFEAARRDLKENLKVLREMEEKIPRLNVDENFKYVYKLMLFFIKKEQEESMTQWDYVESIALNQIEMRKDVTRLIKATKKTKENEKVVTTLKSKIKQSEEDLVEFRKSKHYLEFTKRFWDELAGNKEND